MSRASSLTLIPGLFCHYVIPFIAGSCTCLSHISWSLICFEMTIASLPRCSGYTRPSLSSAQDAHLHRSCLWVKKAILLHVRLSIYQCQICSIVIDYYHFQIRQSKINSVEKCQCPTISLHWWPLLAGFQSITLYISLYKFSCRFEIYFVINQEGSLFAALNIMHDSIHENVQFWRGRTH